MEVHDVVKLIKDDGEVDGEGDDEDLDEDKEAAE